MKPTIPDPSAGHREQPVNKRAVRSVFLGLIILPLVLLASYSFYRSYQDLTSSTLARRQTIAQLTSVILMEKFDHLRDVGLSFANRPHFQDLVRRGKWAEALETTRVVFRDFPYIDHVLLTDVNGTQMASLPEAPDTAGENFAFRDWYRGVSEEWKPYISDIYKRRALPAYNVIALAIPIKFEDGDPAGILVLQVKAETLSQWIRPVEVGATGFVYFVDPSGHSAGHPKFPDEGQIGDFYSFEPVRRVLRGQGGAGIFYNTIDGEERLVAYMPVPGYGWGAIVTQSKSEAFMIRDQNVRFLMIVYASLLLFTILLVYGIWRIQNDLVEKEKEVATVSAEREQLELFAFVASHDLQEPLQKIVGFETLIKDQYSDKLGEEGRRHLERIDKAVQQMMRMMEGIRQFSRIRKIESFTLINLEDLVKEVVADMDYKLVETGSTVQVKYLPRVSGDFSQLRHLFHNLLWNAVKFRKVDRPLNIIVETKPAGKGFCKIQVRDNGIGFDEKYLDQIFTPFKRLHTKSEYEGSGMGLAICRKIAIFHGGSITAKSVPGEGSTFILTLPCAHP